MTTTFESDGRLRFYYYQRRSRADCYILPDWKLANAKRIGQEHVTDNKLRSLYVERCRVNIFRNAVPACGWPVTVYYILLTPGLTTICDSLCSNRLSPTMRGLQKQCERYDALVEKPIKISFPYSRMKGTKKIIIIAQTAKQKCKKKEEKRIQQRNTISGIMRQQPWQPISLLFYVC